MEDKILDAVLSIEGGTSRSTKVAIITALLDTQKKELAEKVKALFKYPSHTHSSMECETCAQEQLHKQILALLQS